MKKNRNSISKSVIDYRRTAPSVQNALETATGLYSTGKYSAALIMMENLLKSQPKNIEAMNIAAACSLGLAKSEDAEKYWTKAIQLKPDYAAAYYNLGNLLKGQKRFNEAEDAYRRTISILPDYADAHNNLGNLFLEQKRLSEAELSYRNVLSIRPNYAEAHNNLGNLLKEQKRFAEAEDVYRRAISIRPDYADAHYNLGILFKEQKRFAKAEDAYRCAISISPSDANVHCSLGRMFQEQKCFAEAETVFRYALSILPDNGEAKLNLGLFLLSLGRFAEGWLLYEARFDESNKGQFAQIPDLSFPQWLSEDLHGKSIVVWPEQGFGDEIQLVRYLPMLKSLGASRVTLVCKPALEALFCDVCGADRVVSGEDSVQLGYHDYWTFPLSLPLRFNTTLETIPADLPYLKADEGKVKEWATKLPTTSFNVGLVWKGNREHKNDANRSLPGLSCLAPLWSVPGVSFISLQKGEGEDEAANPPAGQPIIHLGSDIKDFADTAAIVSQLDLVICVDTAVAHLTGALGKPVWVLIPSIGTDWRWMHDREDSPWYPGVMRLFRQTGMDDWTETIERVADALRELVMKDTNKTHSTDETRTLIRPEDADKRQHTLQSGIPGVTSISMLRRVHDARFATRYFRGDGIDVRGGNDSLALCREFFPLVRHLFVFDQPDGDAQLLDNVPDASFDFLYSSHCLAHMGDPMIALKNWLRVVKPGGHLVITVPDEDLYEQGVWPSRFNCDHKLCFTICKKKSWSPVSVNVLDMVKEVCDIAQPLSIQLIDHGYRYGLAGKGLDQTRTPMAEASIEIVLKKVVAG